MSDSKEVPSDVGRASCPSRCYDVRCFRRRSKGELRHGIWIMTRKTGYRGMFIHGDYNEIEAPKYTVEDLAEWNGGFVDEISPEEALQEVSSWPKGMDEVQRCFDRHPASS